MFCRGLGADRVRLAFGRERAGHSVFHLHLWFTSSFTPSLPHLSLIAPSPPPPAGEGELFDFGQECLDRIALSLGANTVAAAAGALLPVRGAGHSPLAAGMQGSRVTAACWGSRRGVCY